MYDVFVIGGGPAGYVGAIRAAQLGLTVALAEERELGGVCLNRGCVPTKALMHAADAYRRLRELPAMGVTVENAAFDYGRIHDYKRETVAKLRAGVEQLLKANGVTVYPVRARVAAPGRVRVGDELAEARHIQMAVGARPSVPPIPGAGDDPDVFTSDALLEDPDRFYQRLVIIGGGVIGVEMASIYSALGCQVTIIEAMDRLLPMMDREISQNLAMILKKRGVTVHTGASVTGICREGGALTCAFTDKKGRGAVQGDGVLISVGRRPNTEDLFEGDWGPETVRGFLRVNDRYETSVPGVFAVGDCNGILQLAHAAEAQAMACMEYIAGRGEASVDPHVVPACVYTDPEIACAGVTADEAKVRNIPTVTGKYVMNGSAKAVIEGTERSFVKLVFHAETDVLLGAQLMCPRATDLIAELTTAVVNGLTSRQLLAVLRPHPTFAEAVTEAVESAHGQAVHVMPARRR